MNKWFAFSRTAALWCVSFCSLQTPSAITNLAQAQENPKSATPTLKTPSDERIYADIAYLASDELKGRAAETPGLKLAADFIAKRFGELGLQTDLFDGQPFQYFEITGNP
ncbi:MAG: hypothetical protein ACKOAU_13945, partial [Pirellula sp.]